MSQGFIAMALQEVASDNSSMWIILAVVLVILVFIVVIVGVGLTIFFIARKRSKAQKAAAAAAMSTGPTPDVVSSPAAEAEVLAPSAPPEPSPMEAYAPASVPPLASEVEEEAAEPEFDPSRTVAINREPTISINYGSIKFVSGVLAGQEFSVQPEGSYIGRDASMSQILVSDPRISKRHLWIGVRDGKVTVADQDSRNGTFLNDPRSDRITETSLKPGDVVILGESDVARFEYQG